MSNVLAEIAGKLLTLLGYDGTDFRNLSVTTAGHVNVVPNPEWTEPVVRNITMTLANTEYGQALPGDTRAFTIRCRGAFDVKFCFTALASGTTYFTIPSGMTYWDEGVVAFAETLYFQCAEAGQVLEVVAWGV